MKKLSEIINNKKLEESKVEYMTVKDLIKFLQENFDEKMKVMIDESVDGGFTGNRPLIESDIQKLDDDKIIFIAYY